MSVYIVFSFCILLLGKHKAQYTILFLSVMIYQLLFLGYTPLILLLEPYLFASTLLSILFVVCVYDWERDIREEGFDYVWLIEVLSVLSIKVIEVLFILNPEKFYLSFVNHHYFNLDGYFIGGVLFVMFCKEVGYNPFKYNFKRFRKYLLSMVVSSIFFINYI